MIKIKQINGNNYELDLSLSSTELRQHFENPYNYTREIIEEWNSEPFRELISKFDRTILDIGANIGLFALHVLPFADKIICVEPTPEHMVVQRELLSGSKKINHEQAALHNYTGKTAFHRCGINTTMNSLDHQNREAGYEVDCITLFDLCKKYELKHVDLCKIDIEGSETRALTIETVKAVNHIIDKFLVELHPRTREMQDNFKAIFKEAGYKCEYFDFNGSIFCYK